jgi:acyl carrier protein
MVEKIISEVLGCDQGLVQDNSNLVKDLGADSLNIVEIVMQLEEEYGIEIYDEDAEQLHTVKQVKDYIEANA